MKHFKTKIVQLNIKVPGGFSMPLMTTLQKKYRTISRKRKLLLLAAAIVIIMSLVVYAIVTSVINATNEQQKATAVAQSKKYTGAALQTPNYTTVLPSGKTIQSLGGWTRVSPLTRNPVFAFVDAIDGKSINVSEQPLPPELKDEQGNQDDSQIVQLAQSYSANDKVIVGQTTVYIGTSAKGPQSVIFGKNKLLVLIKSSVALTNDQWATYVSTLK